MWLRLFTAVILLCLLAITLVASIQAPATPIATASGPMSRLADKSAP